MEFFYRKREVTVSASKAQIYALVFFIPILVVFGLPYYFLWSHQISHKSIAVAIPGLLTMAIVIIVGVILHELIHGITWAIFCKAGLKSIRFGVMWKSLTPYCNCQERLKINQYRIGAAMPAIILGFIPCIWSLFTGNLAWFLGGVFFSFAAGGDFLIMWMLKKEDKETYVLDHPDKIGCYVFDKVPNDCDC